MEFFKGLFKVLGYFAAILLTVVYMSFLTTLVSVVTTKNILNEKNIENYVSNIDILSLPANDILGEGYDASKTVKDVLESELVKRGIDDDVVSKAISSSELANFLSNFTNQYIDYILNDGARPYVTSTDINRFISINSIESSLSVTLNDKQRSEFTNFVNDLVNSINNDLPSKDSLFEDQNIKEFMGDIKILWNKKAVIYMVLALFILFLLIALSKWSFVSAFSFTGIGSIIVGVLFVASYFLQKYGIKFLTSTRGTFDCLLTSLLDNMFKEFLKSGLIIIAIGIFMLFIKFILGKIFVKQEEDIILE